MKWPPPGPGEDITGDAGGGGTISSPPVAGGQVSGTG